MGDESCLAEYRPPYGFLATVGLSFGIFCFVCDSICEWVFSTEICAQKKLIPAWSLGIASNFDRDSIQPEEPYR
ncbi:MAG: hypothetical protein PHQ75_05800 [Thermoguttaceae bacterium]|nr:hypothetical protein [Thermoguttaceae bacterium]